MNEIFSYPYNESCAKKYDRLLLARKATNMYNFVWQGYPAKFTSYEIIYLGGSNPGIPREFIYDPALPKEFYKIGGDIPLLDAIQYRAILHALESGDYTNLPKPLIAEKLEGRDRMVQLGYALRSLVRKKIESIRLLEVSQQEITSDPAQATSQKQIQYAGGDGSAASPGSTNVTSSHADYGRIVEATVEAMYDNGFPHLNGVAFWGPINVLARAMKDLPHDQRMELGRVILTAVAEDDGETDKAAYGRHMVCATVASLTDDLPNTQRLELLTMAATTASEMSAQHDFEAWEAARIITEKALSVAVTHESGRLLHAAMDLVNAMDSPRRAEKSRLLSALQERINSLVITDP